MTENNNLQSSEMANEMPAEIFGISNLWGFRAIQKMDGLNYVGVSEPYVMSRIMHDLGKSAIPLGSIIKTRKSYAVFPYREASNYMRGELPVEFRLISKPGLDSMDFPDELMPSLESVIKKIKNDFDLN